MYRNKNEKRNTHVETYLRIYAAPCPSHECIVELH